MVLTRTLGLLVLAGAFAPVVPAHGAPTFVGPTPYLRQSDSPFDLSGLGTTFFLEDFEDGLLNTPGVSASVGAPLAPGITTDSVDADDGTVDGSGIAGHSFSSGDGATGITFTFDNQALSGFPTAVGIVWTDGSGTTLFEAFNTVGGSLGVIGPVTIANGSPNGETDEDRFLGVYDPAGIEAIRISNTSGAIEIDHLQYGNATLLNTPTTLVSSTTSTTVPSSGLTRSFAVRVDACVAGATPQLCTPIPTIPLPTDGVLGVEFVSGKGQCS